MVNIKKITAFLAITLALSVGVCAFSGDGTKDSPYTISSLSDLKELADSSQNNSFDGIYFSQTADLTASEIAISTSEAYPFMGIYNGNGFSISGLSLSPVNGVSGLFAHIKDAEILNLNIESAVVEASSIAGGIAGKADGISLISGCSFSGTLIVPSDNLLSCAIGGIAGKVKENASVLNCSSSISVNAQSTPFITYIGGIAGENSGTVGICESEGSMTAVSDNYAVYIGGIAGSNDGTIYGSTNSAAVTATISDSAANLYAGGIAGMNNGGTVERSKNLAAVSAEGIGTTPGYAGGITGYNNNGTVKICENSGEVTGNTSYAGGVSGVNIAESGSATVTDCLNTGDITVSSGIVGGLVGGNIASKVDTNQSVVTSSMNLSAPASGNAAIGAVETDNIGVSEITDLVVKDSSDENAVTMTDAELKASSGISELKASAWVYPKNGFLPALAIAKNTAKAEIITMQLDKSANKAVATIYNDGASKSVIAIVSFFDSSRLINTKFAPLTLDKEYTVFTVESNLVSSASTVNVMVLNSISGLIPAAELATFK